MASATTFSWLTKIEAFQLHHLAILGAFLGVFTAALGAAWSRLADRAEAVLVVPALAVALDWARGHAGFAAVPWLTIGQTQHANAWLLQLASVGGEPLVAAVVVAANVALGQLASGARARAPLVTLGVVVVAHGAGGLLVQPPEGRMLSIVVVQPDFDPRKGREDAVERLDRLTGEAAATRPDLVVWPESAAGDTENDTLSLLQARTVVDRGGVPVLFGSSSASRSRPGHNSLFMMRPREPMGPPYRKVRLVPFAEYAPAMVPAGLGPRMFETIPGAKRTTFELGDVGVEPLVCFESLFADDVRATATAGASVIAIAVNDAWFGASAAPALHNLVGAFRAVENRRPVAIASNGGPSQIFDANGRVVARARPFEQATAAATVRVDTPAGLYRRAGDAVGLALCLGLLALGALGRRAAASPRG